MPFTVPAFEKIRSDMLRDIRNLDTDADITEDSDNWIRATSVASVATGLYQHQAWIVRQIFPDTADTEFLVWHARTRGLYRKAATTASGSAKVTGESGAKAVAGQIITRGSFSWITTAEVTTGADGTGVVPVRVVTAGAAGNSTAEVSGTFATPPTGFDSTVTVGLLSGGTDAETDAALLDRLLDVIRRPPAGGNKYDYRRWALSVDGVTAAYVYPLRRGLGTVDVVITSAGGMPSADIIAACQAYIDEQRPVTAKDTIVLAPTFRKVDIAAAITVQGITFDAAKAQTITDLTTFINNLEPGQPFIKSQAEGVITNITGITDRSISAPAGNVQPVVNATVVEWIRAGNVTVTQL
ncbi:baseplate J/gp47 family protein [Pantoea stewartii]|uniref:baseplate J/gp47 family protein n=1 Tax=Pantoea stewartii TaxID=66269 RepID=UPI003367B35D